jgi:hypothetical protein
MCAFHLYAGEKQQFKNKTMDAHASELVEVVLEIPLKSLTIDSEGIFVDFAGNLLTVHSLEKNGELWRVTAGKNYARCRNGHLVQCPCGGCISSSCWYSCSCESDWHNSNKK